MDPALLLFAFTAGAASFFAPCCVAMLPAYIGYAVRPPSKQPAEMETGFPQGVAVANFRLPRGAARGLAVGGLVPFGVGLVPLLATGLASFDVLPGNLLDSLPPLELSFGLLLAGAVLTVAGLVALGRAAAVGRGVVFGLLATGGFFAVFLPVGLPVAFLAKGLTPYLSYVAVIVGSVLVVLGVSMLAGRTLMPRMPGFKADVSSPKGFFLFGAGYGIAGLSCTFPVFLAVVAAGAVAGGGILASLAMFGAYAAGKGTLLIAVTSLVVAGGASLGEKVKRATPYVKNGSAVLLIAAGGYIAYYFGRLAPGLGS